MLDDPLRLPRIVTIAGAFFSAAVGGEANSGKKQEPPRSLYVAGPSKGGTR